MDSENHKTLSPDEFRPFLTDQKPFVPAPETTAVTSFRLDSDVWKAFQEDPHLRQEWEKRVEEEVARRLETKEMAAKAQWEDEARKAGAQAAQAENAAARIKTQEAFDDLCRQILEEKESLIRIHERVWVHTLVMLLHRFMVPKAVQCKESVVKWIEECRALFPKQPKVKVFVSEETFQALGEALGDSQEEKARVGSLEKDPLMEPGQIRCVLDSGEVFFDAEKAATDLAQKLNAAVEAKT